MLCYNLVFFITESGTYWKVCNVSSNRDKRFKRLFQKKIAEPSVSANKELISIPNIIFIVTGLYFLVVAAIGEGSIYTVAGALLCFISAGLVLARGMLISWPWRLATAAFSIVILLAQLGADFTVSNPSPTVVASVIVNGALFILMLGVLLWTGKDMTAKEGEEEEEEEEEQESKKKKLTYEI